MKKIKLLFLVMVSSLQLLAQRSSWDINAIISHYTREKENELHLGDIAYNINPGLEVLYGYKIKEAFLLKTGISYQYVDLESHVETSDRFRFGEISIPILLTLKNNSGCFSLSTGMYAGRFLHFSWDQQLHSRWVAVNTNQREQYSDKNFFMDAYFDIAYSNSGMITSNSVLKIAPFVRYRFKENWMDYYRTSFIYGIKFCVDFEMKK